MIPGSFDGGGYAPPTIHRDPSFRLPSYWADNIRTFESRRHRVMYAPTNKHTDNIASHVKQIFGSGTGKSLNITGYATEGDLLAEYKKLLEEGGNMPPFPVVFYNITDDTYMEAMNHLSYAIRTTDWSIPDPMISFPFKFTGGPRDAHESPLSGSYLKSNTFISMQTLVNEAFLSYKVSFAVI